MNELLAKFATTPRILEAWMLCAKHTEVTLGGQNEQMDWKM